MVEIVSFKYNKGIPTADLVISVRDYVIPPSVNRVAIINTNNAKYEQIKKLIIETLAKNPDATTIAVGCNNGQIASVAVVEQLALDMKCTAIHRDMEEDTKKSYKHKRKPVYDRSKRTSADD